MDENSGSLLKEEPVLQPVRLEPHHREKLAAARLMAVRQMPYFARALFALQPRPSLGTPTFAVGRGYLLKVNPGFVESQGVPTLAVGLIHEACHLLRNHAKRAEALGVGPGQAAAWNVAADAEINDDLRDLSGAPEWWITPESLGQPEGLLAEQYYRSLPSFGGLAFGESGQDGEGQEAVGSPDCGSGCRGGNDPDDAGGPRGLSERSVDAIARQVAAAVLDAAKTTGRVPAGLVRWAEGLLADPQVDWRVELAALVRGAVAQVAGGVDYSWSRPSRRLDHRVVPRVLLPSLRRPVPKVGVVVDTSGSMSEVDLAAALAEVDGILRAVGTVGVEVYACDSAVAEAQRVFDARQIQLVGGGGTDMGVGIAAAVEGRCDCVVVLTDCETPWPDSPPGVPVVVGAVTDKVPSGVPEWAEVVHIESSSSTLGLHVKSSGHSGLVATRRSVAEKEGRSVPYVLCPQPV
jgi:predicted metal-dependent peptidase